METFHQALQSAEQTKSKAHVLCLLKYIRANRLRESRIVVEYGSFALRSFGSSLGDEKFTLCEQVFIAALDTGDDGLATECLSQLLGQFKNSGRVKRLVGMELEAKGEFEEAIKIYNALLEENPANVSVMKRKICILKGQGKIKDAIRELNIFIEQYQADPTAWQELADL